MFDRGATKRSSVVIGHLPLSNGPLSIAPLPPGFPSSSPLFAALVPTSSLS